MEENKEKKDIKTTTKIFIILGSFLIIGASFMGGALFGYENRPAVEKVLGVAGKHPPQQFAEVDFGIFWDVWNRLEEKHVDRDNINRNEMVLGAIAGMVKALGDPYTEFMRPAESKQFEEDVKGSFGGIGAEIGIRRGTLTIIAPLKGSPAEKAGLQANDKILRVDDSITADMTLDEAVRKIRGPENTPVRLLISRDSFDQPKEIRIVRDIIKINILDTEARPDGIFVIKLYHFTESAGPEFRRAVREFFSSNSNKLVLDLRNNPGGYLSVAVDIASSFLPAGEVVLRERFANGKEDVYRSAGYNQLGDVPTVVLINEGSASASEIVAGALRDAKGVKLIGSKTFGKGSVQEVVKLSGGTSLKLTIAKWFTPKGEEINGKGIEPDVKVETGQLDENDPDEGKDRAMEKAVELLKSL